MEHDVFPTEMPDLPPDLHQFPPETIVGNRMSGKKGKALLKGLPRDYRDTFLPEASASCCLHLATVLELSFLPAYPPDF